MTDIMFGYFIV